MTETIHNPASPPAAAPEAAQLALLLRVEAGEGKARQYAVLTSPLAPDLIPRLPAKLVTALHLKKYVHGLYLVSGKSAPDAIHQTLLACLAPDKVILVITDPNRGNGVLA